MPRFATRVRSILEERERVTDDHGNYTQLAAGVLNIDLGG